MKNTSYPKGEQDALVEAIPGAQPIACPGGHNLQWESGGHEQVAADLRTFLGEP